MAVNLIAYDRTRKQEERYPRYFSHINVLMLLNGLGEVLGIYDAKQLTRDWLKLPGDQFVTKYGFSWTPPESLQKDFRRRERKKG